MISSTQKAALEALKKRDIACSFSHLWSDALFARAQARERDAEVQRISSSLAASPDDAPHVKQAQGRDRAQLAQCRWDRGVYVRWTVITAWMAFERACGEAAADPDVGRNMPQRLTKALRAKGVQPIDWSHGLWREIDVIRKRRITYIHKECTPDELLEGVQLAEDAISVLRLGLVDLCKVVGSDHPRWVECDEIPRRLGGSSAWIMLASEGADDDPLALRIVAVHGEEEWDNRVLRSDEDPWPHVEQLISNIIVPISAIRIYEGDTLLHELPVKIRGA